MSDFERERVGYVRERLSGIESEREIVRGE
jgi:hypothetical protein